MSNRVTAVAVAFILLIASATFADDSPDKTDTPALPKDTEKWAIGAAICIGLSVLVEIALKVLVTLYIVRDAPKRGMDPLIWIVIAVFAEVIGLIVYLCVRKPKLVERPDLDAT
jgi:hypothetical protein